ncbi:IS110 family transposase [Lutispora saccharofermentans]|uniref:Transposase n=1 Tax=Lutispora saccharofermentans TaxID=3024236 RepID=A0ABT1NKM8_9FIRM|nr:transposase [Lutispora saccharofermentans]
MEDRKREGMICRKEKITFMSVWTCIRTPITAVLVNCWNEKLDVIVIENKPSEFNKLAKRVNKKALALGLSPIYGLENAYGYGRSLAVWLIEKGYAVKDVNPSLAYDQRKSAPMMKKNDEHDAYCVATVLINQLHTLPDAKPEDNHWTLSQLVNRRDTLVKDGIQALVTVLFASILVIMMQQTC